MSRPLLPSAQYVVDRLYEVPWFANVGVPEVEDAVLVSSWWEALQHATSVDWKLTKGLPFVKRSIAILSAGPWRVDQLDRQRADIAPVFESLLAHHCDLVELGDDLKLKFAEIVRDDVWLYCREVLTQDIEPPGFYSQLFDWYARGHFPCGWEGEFPAGQPIVY